MRTVLARRLCAALLFASPVLAACSPRQAATSKPPVVLAAQPQAGQDSVPATDEIHPTLSPVSSSSVTEAFGNQVSPTTPPANPAGSREIGSYHAVLMLERAADLMLAGIEKIQAGQILPADTAAISPYKMLLRWPATPSTRRTRRLSLKTFGARYIM